MDFFKKKIKPEWVLRAGLGLVYLYSGYDIFFHPNGWIWAIPQWFAKIVSVFFSLTIYLRFQGVVEFLMGLVLVLLFIPNRFARIVAILSVLEMVSILLFSGINSITFRDIGILGAALALIIILFKSREAGQE